MITNPPDPGATRQRLLEAAGEVFAEHGFRAATVREISTRAGANIAAVNYHFDDKEGLYRAVFRYAYDCAHDKYPSPSAADASRDASERLHAYVLAFLRRILDQGRPAWHGKLMAREMVEPTGALDELVGHAIRPQFDLVTGIIDELAGDALDAEAVRRAAASVVAQCLFYHHSRPVIVRLHPDWRFDADEIATLARHITELTLGGMAQLVARAQAGVAGAPRAAKAAKK